MMVGSFKSYQAPAGFLETSTPTVVKSLLLKSRSFTRKTNIVYISTYMKEVVVNSERRKVEWGWGKRKRGIVFRGYGVLVWENENVLGMSDVDGHKTMQMHFRALNCAFI